MTNPCDQTRPYPRLCAHRGLSGLCPENTLPAFAAAYLGGLMGMLPGGAAASWRFGGDHADE